MDFRLSNIQQITSPLIAKVWKVLTVHGNALRLFIDQGIPPYSNYLYRAPDIAAVGTNFNVVSYSKETDIPDEERMRYMLSHGRGLNIIYNTK